MRFLKKKISLKKDSSEDVSDFDDSQNKPDNVQQEERPLQEIVTKKSPVKTPPPIVEMKEDLLPLRGPRRTKTSADSDSKNIVKNYGKAICAFASSNLSVPYIQNIITKKGYEGFNIEKFMEQMKEKKETTNSMESLRQLLIEKVTDSEEEKNFKQMFKELAIIFMKYFSVNWIFSGRLVHKIAHLKFRFKMLRRIKDPEHFTYLKTTAKTL